MYSLETLYQQALSESDSLITQQRNGLAIIGHGVKLKKFGEDIQILNMGTTRSVTMTSTSYYKSMGG